MIGGSRSTKAGALIPGDTSILISLNTWGIEYAQRRPGRLPRRHEGEEVIAAVADSAQRRPGRLPRRHGKTIPGANAEAYTLNRRPGRLPRRHAGRAAPRGPETGSLNEGRGAYPGDTGPVRRAHQILATRSTKAGALTPATPSRPAGRHSRARLAQRRPGRLPRRHAINITGMPPGPTRSTKAGALTPATPVGMRGFASISRNAQRRPGRLPRRHLRRRLLRFSPGYCRSTKAGALTPATRRVRASPRASCSPLNEGRGAYPGDTTGSSGFFGRLRYAQRRPGRLPRRHPPPPSFPPPRG